MALILVPKAWKQNGQSLADVKFVWDSQEVTKHAKGNKSLDPASTD